MSRTDVGSPPLRTRRSVGGGGWRYPLVVSAILSLVGPLVWFGGYVGGLGAESTPVPGYVSRQPQRAPGFRVQRLGGGTLTLSDQAGTPIVLNLWASWCIPCREEMPAIERTALRHPDVRFIGVAVQDIESASEAFATETGVSFDLGIDDGSVIDAYPTVGLPTTWFIDRNGMIVGQRFGEMTEAELTDRVEKLLGG